MLQNYILNIYLNFLDICCTRLTIASSGLVADLHSEVLGNYSRDGYLNFNIVYKKDDSDHYLYFTSRGNWMVSTELTMFT